jgi:hypothetical protein
MKKVNMVIFKFSNINKFILKWLLFWLSAMGGYILILKPLGINYIENIHITIPYFIASAYIGAYLFKLPKLLTKEHKNIKQVLRLVCLGVVFLIIPELIDKELPLSPEMIKAVIEKQFYYPLFKIESSATKLADIIFQQTLITGLVLYLKTCLEDNTRVIKTFTAVFFILHTPLIFIFSFTGLIFIIPSLLAGVVFSYVILKLKYGIFYSFLTHTSFYIAVGLIYRFL